MWVDYLAQKKAAHWAATMVDLTVEHLAEYWVGPMVARRAV